MRMESAELINSVIVISIMLLLSAFFSGMEIAFLSKNRLREEIDRKQSSMFDVVAHLFEKHPGQYITTILVGNNICLVLYSLYMSILLRMFAAAIGWESMATSSMVLFETIISTIVILFCGEYLPKSIVKKNPNFYYKLFYPVIYFFYLLLYPIASFTTLISYGILRLFGRKRAHGDIDYTFNREDLINLVEGESVEPQHEDEEEIKLFQNALDFVDLRVRDCMVSRVDVEAVDISTSIEDLTLRFIETKYSRIFVWQESIDNIIGYVNSKSLFDNPHSIEQIMMKVDFVAETLPLQTLLQNFIKRKSSVAVVVDEFGGTAGIISMEDVLEQIFGEIEDFWVYDYKNKAYAWRYKYKGWFDVRVKNNEMYIVHENAQEDVYYLDKQRADGALIWSKKMPEFQPVEDLLKFYLIWDNHLIVGIYDHFLASVNAETAEIEWKRDYDQGQDENYRQHDVTALDRPVFVDLKYRRMLFDYHGVTSVDLESGDVLWTFDRDNRRWMRLLAVYDGIAYLSDLGCSPLIIALDTQNGQELWRYTEEVHHDFRSLFVTDDYVIFGNSGSSVITALDRKTGKLAWKLNVGHNIRVGGAENKLLCQDNKLIVAYDYVYVFEVIESQ